MGEGGRGQRLNKTKRCLYRLTGRDIDRQRDRHVGRQTYKREGYGGKERHKERKREREVSRDWK